MGLVDESSMLQTSALKGKDILRVTVMKLLLSFAFNIRLQITPLMAEIYAHKICFGKLD